jgi:hypothetical protein
MFVIINLASIYNLAEPNVGLEAARKLADLGYGLHGQLNHNAGMVRRRQVVFVVGLGEQ